MSNKKGNVIMKKVSTFLLDKPIWIWWIFYVALTGALFGIFHLVLYLLAIQVWIGVLILLAAGLIWGSIAYFRMKGKTRADRAETKESAKAV